MNARAERPPSVTSSRATTQRSMGGIRRGLIFLMILACSSTLVNLFLVTQFPSESLLVTNQSNLGGKPGFAYIQNAVLSPHERRLIYVSTGNKWEVEALLIFKNLSFGLPAPEWKVDGQEELNHSVSSLKEDEVVLMWPDNYSDSFMNHYFHFMEYLFGCFALLREAKLDQKRVRFIIFPTHFDWEGAEPHFINKKVLRALWPEAIILGAEKFAPVMQKVAAGWSFRSHPYLRIPHLVVLDRLAADQDILASQLHKMNGGILVYLRQHLPILQERLLEGLHLHRPALDPHSKARVVIVDRETGDRSMDRALLESLSVNLTSRGFDVDVQKFEKLSFKDQISKVLTADVLLGVHGNGLTHAFWLKPSAVVVEIFPRDYFAFDYQYLSESMSLPHIAWSEYFGLIPGSLDPIRCSDSLQAYGDLRDSVSRLAVSNLSSFISLAIQNKNNWDEFREQFNCSFKL